MNTPEDLNVLLNTERELSAEEQARLHAIGDESWEQFYRVLTWRARAVYSMATAAEFGQCVLHHMTAQERAALVSAEMYTCPQCHRLLKDRRTPVASAALLERTRVQELWLEVEAAPEDDKREAIARFRRALDL